MVQDLEPRRDRPCLSPNSNGNLESCCAVEAGKILYDALPDGTPHLHILCLDGVFSEVGEGESKANKFRNVPTLSDLDTENILKCITTKILKHL